MVEARQLRLLHLAHGIGARRRHGLILAPCRRSAGATVFGARADRHDGRRRRRLPDRLEAVQGSEDVDSQRLGRILKGRRNEALSSQVNDPVGPDRPDLLLDLGGTLNVTRTARRREHVITALRQQRAQMAGDEAAAAGDNTRRLIGSPASRPAQHARPRKAPARLPWPAGRRRHRRSTRRVRQSPG